MSANIFDAWKVWIGYKRMQSLYKLSLTPYDNGKINIIQEEFINPCYNYIKIKGDNENENNRFNWWDELGEYCYLLSDSKSCCKRKTWMIPLSKSYTI